LNVAPGARRQVAPIGRRALGVVWLFPRVFRFRFMVSSWHVPCSIFADGDRYDADIGVRAVPMKRKTETDKEPEPMGSDETTESMVYDGDIYTALVRKESGANPRVASASLGDKPAEDDESVWPFIR
jgi:hypothetical protein